MNGPLEMVYHGLDPRRGYRLRVTYAGEEYALPPRLVARDDVEIHPPRLRTHTPETAEFAIPAEAVTDGTLRLRWFGPEGSGGSGRGRQVAEVWLLPGSIAKRPSIQPAEAARCGASPAQLAMKHEVPPFK